MDFSCSVPSTERSFLAKLMGKDPPPLDTWMLGGDAPTFVRFRGFLYPGGPVWSIELASPAWPRETEP
jgi:hypothetical protein